MPKNEIDRMLAQSAMASYLPSLSVDCTIFGFHAGHLKILLLKWKHNGKWALPGGFIQRSEDVDAAATRVLQERTGLTNIFLQQFHLFGTATRTGQKHARKLLEAANVTPIDDHFLMQRFATVGYYALVDYQKVEPEADALSSECSWHNLADLPSLIIDHNDIISRGLQALRQGLNFQPVGYNLLPKTFPLKDLQAVYETILNRKLDRSNFQRKILGYDILQKLEKHYSGGAHKAPYLYSFDKRKYFEALESGLAREW